MCGRLSQRLTWHQIHTLYQMPARSPAVNLRARVNGCPSQDFAACRLNRESTRTVVKLRWGLIPSWAKDPKIGARRINARAETVTQKPAFRAAFKRRRCLLAVNGWFEWRQEGSKKQPYYISATDGLLSFAGLWERWTGAGDTIESFTIITTEASKALRDIHHRQPAIVSPSDFGEWLAPDAERHRLIDLVRTPFTGPFTAGPISTRVNNARNDDLALIEPLGESRAPA